MGHETATSFINRSSFNRLELMSVIIMSPKSSSSKDLGQNQFSCKENFLNLGI